MLCLVDSPEPDSGDFGLGVVFEPAESFDVVVEVVDVDLSVGPASWVEETSIAGTDGAWVVKGRL